jgi:alanine racemase
MRGKLTISLSAIQKNYELLNEKTGAASCGAVVKADAYGLGIEPVASALSKAGASEFFVALMEEGITLRQILPDATIYVLDGILPNEESEFIEYNLTPVINGFEQKSFWKNNRSCAVHVDTGLNRLGFNGNDFHSLDDLNITLVMSHLASADTPDNPFNGLQRDRLIQATQSMPSVRKSLAASDGIFCGPDFHFNLVRPGAALYGINPIPAETNPMHSVVRLSAPILQIREVQENGYVGYANTQAVKKGQRLATVSLGYADGFFRSLSNKAHLYYKGTALPVLGRVSMDVIVVDISSLPESILAVGDWLEVFGPNQSPDTLAKAAGTIGYEVLTSLGTRFDRIYTA